jgi:hypothetical protein
VPAKGDPQHYESGGKFDGKDNPVKGNNPDVDGMTFSKIDARTYEAVTKKGGKTTVTGANRGRGRRKDADHHPDWNRQSGPDCQQHDVLRKAVRHERQQ